MSCKLFINLIIVMSVLLFLTSCVSINRGSLGHMDRSLNTKRYGYKVIDDFTGNAPTEKIEKFEVRPGDCSSEGSWSDCANDRERSELKEPVDNRFTGHGSEQWYGWSIYFPEDYINIYPTKVALGQFHQVKSHPVWMFQNSDGGYHLDDQVYGHTRHYHKLISENDLRGKWHKIEVHVKWSKKDDGFMKVWINGEQKVNYSGQTMDAETVYFKYGLYRSFMSRYKLMNNVDKVPAQIVYFANVKRSKTREGLKP